MNIYCVTPRSNAMESRPLLAHRSFSPCSLQRTQGTTPSRASWSKVVCVLVVGMKQFSFRDHSFLARFGGICLVGGRPLLHQGHEGNEEHLRRPQEGQKLQTSSSILSFSRRGIRRKWYYQVNPGIFQHYRPENLSKTLQVDESQEGTACDRFLRGTTPPHKQRTIASALLRR